MTIPNGQTGPIDRLRVTVSQRGGRLTEAYRASRRAYVAPLFDYCASHGIITIRVARKAALRAGAGYISRNRLRSIKNGTGVVPPWFIAGVSREIGQPIEVVMGQEWAQRHIPQLPDDERHARGERGERGERRAS